MNYTQVLLNKENRYMVVWIPSQFAIVEKTYNSWVVKETYSTHTQEHILQHEMDYKKQRRASDI